jgi:hypothetical protein
MLQRGKTALVSGKLNQNNRLLAMFWDGTQAWVDIYTNSYPYLACSAAGSVTCSGGATGARWLRAHTVLLVPEEINAQLMRIVDLPKIRSVLQRYISGMYVTGSMQGGSNSRHPDFERLSNIDEVWVMCFRQPKMDQWRLMGRFAAFNAFVGLAFFRRAFLDGKKNTNSAPKNLSRVGRITTFRFIPETQSKITSVSP